LAKVRAVQSIGKSTAAVLSALFVQGVFVGVSHSLVGVGVAVCVCDFCFIKQTELQVPQAVVVVIVVAVEHWTFFKSVAGKVTLPLPALLSPSLIVWLALLFEILIVEELFWSS